MRFQFDRAGEDLRLRGCYNQARIPQQDQQFPSKTGNWSEKDGNGSFRRPRIRFGNRS